MNFSNQYDSKLLNNKQVIELLNLQNTLKNLTIFCSCDSQHELNAIEKILKKEYYFNLEKVNILLNTNTHVTNLTHDIFKLLKRNHQLLKYQFKQLNIGFEFWDNVCQFENHRYHVFAWNSSVDEKFLDEQCKICVKYEKMNQSEMKVGSMQEKFDIFESQWVDGFENLTQYRCSGDLWF